MDTKSRMSKRTRGGPKTVKKSKVNPKLEDTDLDNDFDNP